MIRRYPWTAIFGWACVALLPAATGCTGLNLLFGPDLLPEEDPATNIDLGIAVAQPAAATTAEAGSKATIQWADIATVPGTTVRVQAQRVATSNGTPLPGAFTGPAIQLVGNGTPGSGRDALADGDNDLFDWNLAGVLVGSYVITATIESPDGESVTAVSLDATHNVAGVINITTQVPVPTMTFTAPGATDVNVTTGNTFDITWTDNGNANAAALLRLALDPDDDHENGNEITLLSNAPLSEDGNNGLFTFFFQDENGDTVPDGTYTVFSVLNDGLHDPVTVEATGQLILN